MLVRHNLGCKLFGMQAEMQDKMARVDWEWHDSLKLREKEQNWIEILLTKKKYCSEQKFAGANYKNKELQRLWYGKI